MLFALYSILMFGTLLLFLNNSIASEQLGNGRSSSIIYRANYKPRPDDDISVEEMIKYFFVTNASACRMAIDFGYALEPSESMGGMGPDGFKSVCFDPGVRPVFNNCLVYSFGIRDEWSFDEAMQNYGCDVYAFDPSMDGVEDHQHSERIWFFKLGLFGENIDKEPLESWKMRTLDSIYETLQERHGRRVIDYLKIDIEFSEWKTLPQIFSTGLLANVKQIGMDVHLREAATLDTLRKQYRMIRALEEEHGFIRFSSRPSVWAKVNFITLGKQANYAFEMAWYNSKFVNETFAKSPLVFW